MERSELLLLKNIVEGICDTPYPNIYLKEEDDIIPLRIANPHENDADLCNYISKKSINSFWLSYQPPIEFKGIGYSFILALKVILEGKSCFLFLFDRIKKELNHSQIVAIKATIKKNHLDSKNKQKLLNQDRLTQGLRVLNKINELHGTTKYTLTKALELSCVYLEMDYGVISDISNEKYKVTHCYPVESPIKISEEVPLNTTYCDMTHKGNRTVAIDDMENSEFSSHPCFEKFKLKSYLGTNFSSSEQKGVIAFSKLEKRRKKFSRYEIEFIELLSSWLSGKLNYMNLLTVQESQESNLKSFIESMPAAIAMCDRDMKFIAASNQWITDYNVKRNIIGVSLYSMYPDIDSKWRVIYKRALNGEVLKSEEELFHTDNGNKVYLKWEIKPWYDRKGSIGGLIIFTDDITKKVERKKELIKAIKKTEEAIKVKEQFTYIASHDLQEPIKTLISLSEMMKNDHMDSLNDQSKQIIEYIHGSSIRMSKLVKGLLDYSRLGVNRKLQKVDLNELIKEVKIDLGNQINNSSSSIIVDELPTIDGYRLELRQLFQNLISNALKFGKPKMMNAVNVSVEETDDYWELCIEDNGIGIPEKMQETIFKIFKKLDNPNNKEGIGIGLANCKKIVELHDGSIWVESKVDIGSKFYFTVSKEIH